MTEESSGMYMGRLHIPVVNELFIKYFGKKDFTIDMVIGKSSFDTYLLDAIITASEEKIIESPEEAEIVVQYFHKNIENILKDFDSRKYKILHNQNLLRTNILQSLNKY